MAASKFIVKHSENEQSITKTNKKHSKIDNLEIGCSFSLFFMPKARKNEPIRGFPRIPPDPADPVHGLPLGTSRPHAPGVRMTVVLKTNSLKPILAFRAQNLEP